MDDILKVREFAIQYLIKSALGDRVLVDMDDPNRFANYGIDRKLNYYLLRSCERIIKLKGEVARVEIVMLIEAYTMANACDTFSLLTDSYGGQIEKWRAS